MSLLDHNGPSATSQQKFFSFIVIFRNSVIYSVCSGLKCSLVVCDYISFIFRGHSHLWLMTPLSPETLVASVSHITLL